MVTPTNLPTGRTAAGTIAEHVADHNGAHSAVNELTADHVPNVRVQELGFNIKHPDFAAATHHDMIMNAMDAATAEGRGRKVVIPPGVWDVGNGLSLSGQTCTLEGSGGGTMQGILGAAVASGVTIKASTQTGPVLDFQGYVWPVDHRGRLSFGNFIIEGSNVADATKARSGIRMGSASMGDSAGGARFHDIVITKTGGPGMDLRNVYLCDFDRITVVTPVSAQTNDVPYIWGRNVNANTFKSIGIRSITSTNDCGASGAVIIEDDGVWPTYGTKFVDWWYEFLHIPTGGCMFKLKGNFCVVEDFTFSDCLPVAAATNTASLRIEDAAIESLGGNMIRGMIPGGNLADTVNYPTYGVVVSQPRNSIVGVKAYRGSNVRLLTGSDHTFVALGGSYADASDPAVINNSGVNNHTIIDEHLGLSQHGPYRLKEKVSSGNNGVQVEDPAATGSGAVWLGDQDVRVQAVGQSAYLSALNFYFRRQDTLTNAFMSLFLGGTSDPSIQAGTGSPEGVRTANKGSIFLRSDGGAGTSFYVKETGTGNTGWVAK